MQHRRYQRTGFWAGRLSASMLDQGFHAGSNFLMSLYLARTLVPRDFGAFSVSYSIFLLSFSLFSALCLEPMSIIIGSRKKSSINNFITSSILLFFFIYILISLIFMIVSIFFEKEVANSLAAAAWSCVPYFSFYFFRRLAYSLNIYVIPVYASFAYAITALGGVIYLYMTQSASSASGFYIIAAAALAGTVVYALMIWRGDRTIRLATPRSRMMKAAVRSYWHYGRWNMLNAIFGWLASAPFLPLLGAFHGLAAAGAFRILELFFTPLRHVFTAFEFLLLPRFASMIRLSNASRPLSAAYKIAGLCSIATVGYGLVIWMSAGDLLALLSKSATQYEAYTGLLPYFIILMLTRSAGSLPFGLYLKGAGEFRLAFLATTAAMAFSVTIGVLMVWRLGIEGAVFGMTASAIIGAALMIFFTKRLAAGSQPQPASP